MLGSEGWVWMERERDEIRAEGEGTGSGGVLRMLGAKGGGKQGGTKQSFPLGASGTT